MDVRVRGTRHHSRNGALTCILNTNAPVSQHTTISPVTRENIARISLPFCGSAAHICLRRSYRLLYRISAKLLYQSPPPAPLTGLGRQNDVAGRTLLARYR